MTFAAWRTFRDVAALGGSGLIDWKDFVDLAAGERGSNLLLLDVQAGPDHCGRNRSTPGARRSASAAPGGRASDTGAAFQSGAGAHRGELPLGSDSEPDVAHGCISGLESRIGPAVGPVERVSDHLEAGPARVAPEATRPHPACGSRAPLRVECCKETQGHAGAAPRKN